VLSTVTESLQQNSASVPSNSLITDVFFYISFRSHNSHAPYRTLYRMLHKDLNDVKLPITYEPTVTGKYDSSLMTSYQDVGLGKRD
jgi:hypothetical protein